MTGHYFKVKTDRSINDRQVFGEVYLVNDDGSPWSPDQPADIASMVAQPGPVKEALNSGYLPRRTRTVWATGDSITEGSAAGGGGHAIDSTLYSTKGQPGLQYQGGAWTIWALFSSEARWTIGGVLATGGYTAAQILDTHVPAIIASATPGDTVVVMAGTNGAVVADVEAIHRTLREAGLHTVACTIPPSTAAGLSLVASFNARLRVFAAEEGIPLVDVHAAVVDVATGAYQGIYDGDGIHPNQLGAQKIGQTIAAVLNSFHPTPVELVTHNAAVTGQQQTKPLALGSPVSPTDYNPLVALGTSTIAAAPNSYFRGGQGYKFTRQDTSIDARLAYSTLTPGNRMRIGFALEAVRGASGSWGIRWESQATGGKVVWGFGFPGGFTISQPAGRFYIEVTVPAVPDFQYRPRLSVSGAAGNYLHLGEITVQDLTVMGL